MANYLITATQTYRVPTEAEALKLKDILKEKASSGELIEFSYKTKTVKSKGEIVDEWQQVTAKFKFNDEKLPEDDSIEISFKGEYND